MEVIKINYYHKDTVKWLKDTLLELELHEDIEEKQRLISLSKNLILAFEKNEDYCPTVKTLEDYFCLIDDIYYIVNGDYEVYNSGRTIILYA